MTRGELADEQWEQFQPLPPAQKPRTGRPARSHREILNAMLWIAPHWRPLARFTPTARLVANGCKRWQTVASRFYRWRQAGVLGRLLAALPSPSTHSA